MLVVAIAVLAATAVPDDIVVAGRLFRDGVAVDGTVSAVFTVYDDADAGQERVSIEDPSVVVSGGVFVAELTGLVPIVDGGPLFVEVTLDGETLSPRLALGTVPYAAVAGAVDVDDVVGLPADLLDGDQVAIQGNTLVPIFPLSVSGNNLSINNNTISGDLLQDGAVRNEKILNGAIISSKIAGDAVQAQHIAGNAVGQDEIANNSVGGDELQDGAVGPAELQDNAVGNNELADNAVGNAELRDNAVSTNELADGAVVRSKIGDGAVNAAKLATDSIGRAQLIGAEQDAFFVDNAACEGISLLSPTATCRSRICGVNANALVFTGCDNQCNQTAPQTCPLNNRAGRLLSPVAP